VLNPDGDIPLADPLAQALPRTYSSGWLFADGAVALGTSDGRVFLVSGTTYREIQTPFNDGIRKMWGAEDGTLFVMSQFELGRLAWDGAFDVLFAYPASYPYLRRLDDLWGNGPNEVFVGVHDIEFGESCGYSGMLFFDGTELHRF
jgi:hypothetical protein